MSFKSEGIIMTQKKHKVTCLMNCKSEGIIMT